MLIRQILAAGLAAACLGTGLPASAQTTAANWTYAYENGVATSTLLGADGKPAATISCAPPTGEIILTDYTFGRASRNAAQAVVTIGWMSVTIPAVEERLDRRTRVLRVRMPQRPPVLAAMNETDHLTVTVNNVTRDYQASGAKQLKDIAYACWGGPA